MSQGQVGDKNLVIPPRPSCMGYARTESVWEFTHEVVVDPVLEPKNEQIYRFSKANLVVFVWTPVTVFYLEGTQYYHRPSKLEIYLLNWFVRQNRR